MIKIILRVIKNAMIPLNKSQLESAIIGEWKSELEEMIYVFSDSPSCLKNGSLDLLASNIKTGSYFLTTYDIKQENENVFIELGKDKSSVKYFVTNAADNEIHLENQDGDLLILKKL